MSPETLASQSSPSDDDGSQSGRSATTRWPHENDTLYYTKSMYLTYQYLFIYNVSILRIGNVAMASQNCERIVVRDQNGNLKVTWERPILGDLTMKNESGRTILEKTGLFGGKTIYLVSDRDSVEADIQ